MDEGARFLAGPVVLVVPRRRPRACNLPALPTPGWRSCHKHAASRRQDVDLGWDRRRQARLLRQGQGQRWPGPRPDAGPPQHRDPQCRMRLDTLKAEVSNLQTVLATPERTCTRCPWTWKTSNRGLSTPRRTTPAMPAPGANGYYPEVIELMQRTTGAGHALPFDHDGPCADEAEHGEDNAVRFSSSTTTIPANPAGSGSATSRLRTKRTPYFRRFAVVNVWKAIVGPIRRQCRQHGRRGLHPSGSNPSGPRRRDPRRSTQPAPRMAVLPEYGAWRSDAAQVLRLRRERPRTVHRPFGVRGPRQRAGRTGTRERRDAHTGVLPTAFSQRAALASPDSPREPWE